jgi:hypothetical protein
MELDEIPDFETARQKVALFLKRQGLAGTPQWIMRDDALYWNRRTWIKSPVPSKNEAFHRRLYNEGIERDLGIRIETLVRVGNVPYCYVWLPEDVDDAGSRLLLMSKFIISCPRDLEEAKEVHNSLLWNILKATQSKAQFRDRIGELPTRT